MNEPSPSAVARPPSHFRAREYETIYILRFDVDAESAERVQARVNDAVEREHGKLVKVETWGRRRLAYPLNKQRRGVYVYLKYVGAGGLVAEVERNLKLQDAVVKFMTVQTADNVDLESLQIDPEETKLAKLEPPPEDEKEESREKQLGLIDLGPDAPRAPRPQEDPEEFEGPPPDDADETAAKIASAGAPATMPAAGNATPAGGTGNDEET